MKLWKIIVLVPYALIGLWLLISFSMIGSGTIGGIFAGAGFLAVGLMAGFVYSVFLSLALLLRWIIQRRRDA
jgi:hypothetical protein